MNDYLIPANSKRGQLYFNVFRLFDMVLLLAGILFSLVLMFAIPGDTVFIMFIKLLPLGITVLLVMPIPYYHNVLVFLQEVYLFLIEKKQYKWKGWCASYEFNDEQK